MEQPTEQQMEQQCIFCQIANGKVESKKIYEDDKVMAVLDIHPAEPGHILVIPKKHVSIMPQMDEELVGHIGMISKQLSHCLITALAIEGTSIFVANGAAAGQKAPHFMLHIIPRKQGDGISLQLPAVQLSNTDMNQIVQKISPGIQKQFGVDPAKFGAKVVPDKEVLSKKEEKKEVEEDIEAGKEEKEIEEARETQGVSEPKRDIEEEKEEEKKPDLNDIANFLAGGQ